MDPEHCGECGGSLDYEEQARGDVCDICAGYELASNDLAAIRADRDALASALRALVASLPKCDACPQPATRAYRRVEGRYCDVHAWDGCP